MAEQGSTLYLRRKCYSNTVKDNMIRVKKGKGLKILFAFLGTYHTKCGKYSSGCKRVYNRVKGPNYQ